MSDTQTPNTQTNSQNIANKISSAKKKFRFLRFLIIPAGLAFWLLDFTKIAVDTNDFRAFGIKAGSIAICWDVKNLKPGELVFKAALNENGQHKKTGDRYDYEMGLIIAVPGDKVSMKDGIIKINDLPITEKTDKFLEYFLTVDDLDTDDYHADDIEYIRSVGKASVKFRKIRVKILGSTKEVSVIERTIDGDSYSFPETKLKEGQFLVLSSSYLTVDIVHIRDISYTLFYHYALNKMQYKNEKERQVFEYLL